ncbi:acyl-CoA thioesterase [Polluticoccus soli]|uniref:acyl-CoA thioesterase n=1 Tax=Polluticoccus soli TaxID=3034150 RepID=UPI0023E0A5FA|nr:thioesterase family protein [Flavipsychrobacter sp. JY13-12]
MQTLTHTTELEVKFSEADPLGIVWHGHFIRYFEDGREAFGEAYGIRYLDFYRSNIVVPIVSIHCDYKRILRYGHKIRLETTYHDSPAAKLIFHYAIYDAKTDEQVAKGNSTQVFMDKEKMELMLTLPQFMTDWKEKWLKG